MPRRPEPHDISVHVPYGRAVWMVEATDGISQVQATIMTTMQAPGSLDRFERWQAFLEEPPTKVIVHFNPVSR